MADRPEGLDSLIHGVASELSPEDFEQAQQAAKRAKDQSPSQEMLRFKMFAADTGEQP